jgi:hypothetical protein
MELLISDVLIHMHKNMLYKLGLDEKSVTEDLTKPNYPRILANRMPNRQLYLQTFHRIENNVSPPHTTS